MRPTKFDGILACALIAAVLLSWGAWWLLSPDADTTLVAVIAIDGAEYDRLPLQVDTALTLPTGHVVLVKEREVSVISAPCPDHICVDTPAARTIGNCIICLPEKVVITIEEDHAA